MSEIIESITSFVERYVTWLSIPSIMWTDLVEVLIVSVLLYKVLAWIKESKAWSLLKGILFILLFVMVAAMLSMTTILWIAKNVFGVAGGDPLAEPVLVNNSRGNRLYCILSLLPLLSLLFLASCLARAGDGLAGAAGFGLVGCGVRRAAG